MGSPWALLTTGRAVTAELCGSLSSWKQYASSSCSCYGMCCRSCCCRSLRATYSSMMRRCIITCSDAASHDYKGTAQAYITCCNCTNCRCCILITILGQLLTVSQCPRKLNKCCMYQGKVEKQPLVKDRYMTLQLADNTSLVWTASSPLHLTASSGCSSPDQTCKIVNCRGAQITAADSHMLSTASFR